MKTKALRNFSTIMILGMFALLACRQKNSSNNSMIAENKTTEEQTISIDTFSVIPPEISGCSCIFSNDSNEYKNNEYIYANNFANFAYAKINGEFIKFEQIKYDTLGHGMTLAKYKSENYEMEVEVKNSKQSGYEATTMTGLIRVTTKTRKTIVKEFFGICGC